MTTWTSSYVIPSETRQGPCTVTACDEESGQTLGHYDGRRLEWRNGDPPDGEERRARRAWLLALAGHGGQEIAAVRAAAERRACVPWAALAWAEWARWIARWATAPASPLGGLDTPAPVWAWLTTGDGTAEAAAAFEAALYTEDGERIDPSWGSWAILQRALLAAAAAESGDHEGCARQAAEAYRAAVQCVTGEVHRLTCWHFEPRPAPLHGLVVTPVSAAEAAVRAQAGRVLGQILDRAVDAATQRQWPSR